MQFDINDPKTFSSVVNGHVISNNVAVQGRQYQTSCSAGVTFGSLQNAIDFANGEPAGTHVLPVALVVDEVVENLEAVGIDADGTIKPIGELDKETPKETKPKSKKKK
jgi:hypothetical protein